MTTEAARTLLVGLRHAGVVLEAEGDRLIVDAPSGVVTPETAESLRGLKPQVLAALAEERRVLDMSLADFERSRLRVEVGVPWLSFSLWWVSTAADVLVLERRGVARGRIWTAGELAEIFEIANLDPADAQRIIVLKTTLDLEILSVSRDGITE